MDSESDAVVLENIINLKVNTFSSYHLTVYGLNYLQFVFLRQMIIKLTNLEVKSL